MLDEGCTDSPICPYCGKEWDVNELDYLGESDMLYGQYKCHFGNGGCGKEFEVKSFVTYSTNKIKGGN